MEAANPQDRSSRKANRKPSFLFDPRRRMEVLRGALLEYVEPAGEGDEADDPMVLIARQMLSELSASAASAQGLESSTEDRYLPERTHGDGEPDAVHWGVEYYDPAAGEYHLVDFQVREVPARRSARAGGLRLFRRGVWLNANGSRTYGKWREAPLDGEAEVLKGTLVGLLAAPAGEVDGHHYRLAREWLAELDPDAAAAFPEAPGGREGGG